MTAYFKGYYTRARSLLASVETTNNVGRSQVVLFRAASSFALFMMGREKDATLRKRAIADLQE